MDFQQAFSSAAHAYSEAIAERKDMMMLRAMVEMWPSLHVVVQEGVAGGALWMLQSGWRTIGYVWGGCSVERGPELRYLWTGNMVMDADDVRRTLRR